MDLDLSGKGLSGQTIITILKGFNTSQPNVKLRSVNLSGNIVGGRLHVGMILANNTVFQSILMALPPTLEEFVWQFDDSPGTFNLGGLLNYTLLQRFSSLTHLDLGGWPMGNFNGDILLFSQAFPSFSNLTYLNMSSTSLGAPFKTETTVFLTALFQNCPKLQTALFSDTSLGSNLPDIIALQQGLQNASSLQTLTLDNTFIGYGDFNVTAAFLQSLRRTNLRALSLKNNFIGSQNSTTGQTHANVLATSLPPTLKDFDISGNYLSNSQSDEDFRLLASGIANLTALERLFIARQTVNAPSINTNFTDFLRATWTNRSLSSQNTDLFAFVSSADVTAYFNALSPNATALYLARKLTPQVYSSLASAILNLPNATKARFTTVDLSGNNNVGYFTQSFTPNPFSQLLAPAIGTLTNVRELHVEDNNIIAILDQSAWANVTARFSLLKEAYFQGNRFGRGDFSGLGGAFNQTKSLTTLDLGSNPNLSNSPSPIASLGLALSSLRNLTDLLLSHAGISGATSSAPTSGANLFRFFQNLQSASSLRTLDLSFNRLGATNSSDGIYLGNALRSLRNLTRLDISYNPIDRYDPQGAPGAQVIVDSILYLIVNGKLNTFNLAGSMTLPATYWTQNQAAFRNITNPILLAGCPSYLSALLNVTNSSSSSHQRRSLSGFNGLESSSVSHISALREKEDSYDPNSFEELAVSDSAFDSEALHEAEGNTPSSVSENIDPLYTNYATSGASSLQPPQPFRWISGLVGSALQYWRGAPPSLSMTFNEGAKMPSSSSDSQRVLSTNASLPEEKTQPFPSTPPLNGTASKDMPKDQKNRLVPRPDPEIKDPYVKTLYHQVESSAVTGLWLWAMAEKWAEWMLEETEEITDGILFETEHIDRLGSSLKKTERALWALSESKDQSTRSQFEDLLDVLQKKFALLSAKTIVSRAELTRFERNLASFKRALKDEESSLSYSREFNHKRTVLENAFKKLSQTLEFMKAEHQMSDEALQENQMHLGAYHRMFLHVEVIPELHQKKKALAEIKERLDALSLSLNVRHTLRNLSSLLEALKKAKKLTEDDFASLHAHITQSEDYLLRTNTLFDLEERKDHLIKLQQYLDSFSGHLEVEYTFKDISVLLDILQRTNEISTREFNSYQFDLTRLAQEFQALGSIVDPVKKQKKLSKLRGQVSSFSRFLKDTYDITVPETYSPHKNTLSHFVALHQDHMWVDTLLVRFSSTLDFLRTQRGLPQADFEAHQSMLAKQKEALVESENLFNFQDKKDRLDALKAQLDKALRSLQKKHSLKAEETRFPVNEAFSSFVPFYKECQRVEHILRNLTATLQTLKAEKKMSLWHFESHLDALERHKEALSNLEKFSQDSEKHARLKELKGSLFLVAEGLERAYGVNTDIDVSALSFFSDEYQSFSKAHLWMRHLLENTSDALQTVMDQERMSEKEFKNHQIYFGKARNLLFKLENTSNTQKRKSDLKRLKTSLEEFSKYLRKTHGVKVAGPFSLKTVDDPVGPEESLRYLFSNPKDPPLEDAPSQIFQNERANVPVYLI